MTAKYEPGLIVAKADFVRMHGRYSGIGLPADWIAVNIIQDEATREQPQSGNPMFGEVFPQENALK